MNVSEYTPEQLKALIPHPGPRANKYTRGKLVVVAGSAAYPGAAGLAATASQRMGAGYTEVVCAPESVDVVRGYRPSLVVRSWKGCTCGDIVTVRDGDPLACVVGPGIDAADGFARALTLDVLREAAVPVLIDGGALSVLATGEGMQAARMRDKQNWPLVITPHTGEARRLESAARIPTPARANASDDASQANTSDGAFQANAPDDASPAEEAAGENSAERACALAQAYSCIVMLKGPDTYISDGERTVVMREGTSALAKAGTGDVLAGMTGALLAQNVDPFDAAVLAATLHAEAGRAAAQKLGDVSVVPEDVIEAIPGAICEIG